MYDPLPTEFLGNTTGPHFPYNSIYSFVFLFHLFWTATILNDIVDETNEYAQGLGTTIGSNWEDLTVSGLKAFRPWPFSRV